MSIQEKKLALIGKIMEIQEDKFLDDLSHFIDQSDSKKSFVEFAN